VWETKFHTHINEVTTVVLCISVFIFLDSELWMEWLLWHNTTLHSLLKLRIHYMSSMTLSNTLKYSGSNERCLIRCGCQNRNEE
jgi:hypothetical protein